MDQIGTPGEGTRRGLARASMLDHRKSWLVQAPDYL